MPGELPERLEAGTQNMHGIAGLYEGIKFVKRIGVKNIAEHERRLIGYAVEKLSEIEGIRIYNGPLEIMSGVLSFRVEGMESEDAAYELAKREIAVRAGLHCAPLAHRSAGTLPEGTVRMSVSRFSRKRDVDYLAGGLRDIVKRKKR